MYQLKAKRFLRRISLTSLILSKQIPPEATEYSKQMIRIRRPVIMFLFQPYSLSGPYQGSPHPTNPGEPVWPSGKALGW